MLLLLSSLVFITPTLIAHQRKAKHFGAIYLTNLLFCWTFFGWTFALLWAMSDESKKFKYFTV